MLSPTMSRKQSLSHRPASRSNDNDFFAFNKEDAASFDSDTEVIEYLNLGSEMEILNRFPTTKTMSMKFNIAKPSGVAGEGLFSLGSLVMTPRRNRLSDKQFERLLLMRYYQCLRDKHIK